jgi:AbiJ N-terminal domain 4
MRFSQRIGRTRANKVLQLEGMDDELRNGLWNLLRATYLETVEFHHRSRRTRDTNREPLFLLFWHNFFKRPIDEIPEFYWAAVDVLRAEFFRAPWYEVFDLIEFTAGISITHIDSDKFRLECDSVLERENSAYRFVGNGLAAISSPEEIEGIVDALAAADSLRSVKLHLGRARELLTDRKNPDFRNSMKESISSVEALARIVAGRPDDASVGDALAVLESRGAFHGALKKALGALYGYTSNADGIRHAALEEPSVTFADAKFMLVACSAFVYYVIAKAAERNIPLETR